MKRYQPIPKERGNLKAVHWKEKREGKQKKKKQQQAGFLPSQQLASPASRPSHSPSCGSHQSSSSLPMVFEAPRAPLASLPHCLHWGGRRAAGALGRVPAAFWEAGGYLLRLLWFGFLESNARTETANRKLPGSPFLPAFVRNNLSEKDFYYCCYFPLQQEPGYLRLMPSQFPPFLIYFIFFFKELGWVFWPTRKWGSADSC